MGRGRQLLYMFRILYYLVIVCVVKMGVDVAASEIY